MNKYMKIVAVVAIIAAALLTHFAINSNAQYQPCVYPNTCAK